MTDCRTTESHQSAISRAMEEEGILFFDVVRLDGSQHTEPPQSLLAQCGAAMFAAGAAAAKRLLRERGGDDEALRSYLEVANRMERELPPELHAMWRLHFIDGHALSEYAAGTGRDMTAACADYRDLVRALVPKPREASAGGEHDAEPRVETWHAATA
jgi:hypothetical protein